MLDHAPVRAIDSDTRKTIYEAPGLLRVRHGRSCVEAPNATSDSKIGFRIQDREAIPPGFADSGTVFMNGWELRYKNADHHVQGLGSAIVNINATRDANGSTLSWEAGGVLSDENGDDPFEWCYSYTIVLWTRNSSAFDAVLLRSGLGFMQTTGSDPGNGTALRNLSGYSVNAYGPGVVLPQGFAMMWADSSDRHLIQAGFDYGSHVGSPGEISWNSRTVFKDNDERNDYYGAELVSVLSYASPQTWHPETVLRESPSGWTPVTNAVSLAPQASQWFCTAIGDSTGEAHYKVENVPFHYAVPVLKGWELGYLCSDHHVRQIGASITDFRYERAPNAATGTLYYTLSLNLKDDDGNINYGAASIDILGLNALGAGAHPVNPPGGDISPVAPASCNFGNRIVADGSSVTAYASAQSAVCEPCESQTRVCHNGALTGSYSFASCTVRRPGPRQQCP